MRDYLLCQYPSFKPYKDPASTEDGLYNQLKESKLKMIPSEAIE